MKHIDDLKERQHIAQGVLEYLKKFCDENNIIFMLAYGTLLGAVRHRGFIPWDDDVDVMMTRQEYNKFITTYNNDEHSRYKLLCPENSREYFAPLAKIYDSTTVIKQHYGQIENTEYGIYVDIFIIDNMPDLYCEAKKFYKKAEFYRLMWAMAARNYNAPYFSIFSLILRTPVMFLTKLLGIKFWLNQYDRHARKYHNKTKHSGIVIYGEGIEKEYTDDSQYTQFSIVSFEGVNYMAPKDTDKCLKMLYKDYMRLPKECDRKVHPSDAYYK